MRSPFFLEKLLRPRLSALQLSEKKDKYSPPRVLNQPIRFPGLKPGVGSGLILSGAFCPDLKIGDLAQANVSIRRASGIAFKSFADGRRPFCQRRGPCISPGPPGTSPGGSPISKLMGPPPLRGLCMAPDTAQAASRHALRAGNGDIYLRCVSPFPYFPLEGGEILRPGGGGAASRRAFGGG